MEHISAGQAAERWNLTPRRVQELCKEGRIPGAVRFGRNWMIPADAAKPGRRNAGEQRAAAPPLLRYCPSPDMTDLYREPGTVDAVIEALAPHPETALLFQSCIAYQRCEFDFVLQNADILKSTYSDVYAAILAGLLRCLVAAYRGDTALYRQARKELHQAPCRSEEEREMLRLWLAFADATVRDEHSYPEWFTKGQFSHVHADAYPAVTFHYARYLYFRAQALAMGELRFGSMKGLDLQRTLPGIYEPMIAQTVREGTLIAEIGLRTVRQSYRETMGGWIALHNAHNPRSISGRLSPRERETARLAAFGLSNKEIADRLGISIASVKTYISMAMSKTGAENRFELGAFL